MEQLTLVSKQPRLLKPLVEAALRNELRLLQAGIQRSEQKLQQWESRFGLPTLEFVRRYENDQFEESLELAEWIGEHRLMTRLLEKAQILQEVTFAN